MCCRHEEEERLQREDEEKERVQMEHDAMNRQAEEKQKQIHQE